MGKSKESEYEEYDTMTLTLEDGMELECFVISVFPVDDKQYIALLPKNSNGTVDDDAQIFLYRFQEFENGDISIDQIEDDDEFELVSDRFDELLDEEEFDALFE